jgi:hypothetical protein
MFKDISFVPVCFHHTYNSCIRRLQIVYQHVNIGCCRVLVDYEVYLDS